MSEWVEYMTFEGVSPMADQRKENGHEEAWTVDYFGVGNRELGLRRKYDTGILWKSLPQISDIRS